jgi:hypothetical protein
MRLEDAPPAGWYPDPEGTRLRWWDGTDWTDRFRIGPSAGSPPRGQAPTPVGANHGGSQGHAAPGWYPDPAGGPRPRWWDGRGWTDQLGQPGQAAAIVGEVGAAVRAEASRAAAAARTQASEMRRELTPLITEYTNRATRFLKRLLVIAIVLACAWFIFQAYANATFFEWLGDRIDGLSDGSVVGTAWAST